MKNVYIEDRNNLLIKSNPQSQVHFTEENTKNLPEVVRKYLKVCGYIGASIPYNAQVYWQESWLRLSPKHDWGPLETLQFNSVNPIGRVAYMKFLNKPVAARDIYYNGFAEIKGKLFNLFKVVFDNSRQTAQSALITTFC